MDVQLSNFSDRLHERSFSRMSGTEFMICGAHQIEPFRPSAMLR